MALVGDELAPLERAVRERFRPHIVLAGAQETGETAVPLLEGRAPVGGRAAAYVCENFSCRMPVTDPMALEDLLA